MGHSIGIATVQKRRMNNATNKAEHLLCNELAGIKRPSLQWKNGQKTYYGLTTHLMPLLRDILFNNVWLIREIQTWKNHRHILIIKSSLSRVGASGSVQEMAEGQLSA